MKPVFKCDYCKFMGTEKEVKEHEPVCMDNYDRKSCYTCQHRGRINMVNNLIKYECKKDIDVPEGMINEYCELYKRKEKSNSPYLDLVSSMFGF